MHRIVSTSSSSLSLVVVGIASFSFRFWHCSLACCCVLAHNFQFGRKWDCAVCSHFSIPTPNAVLCSVFLSFFPSSDVCVCVCVFRFFHRKSEKKAAQIRHHFHYFMSFTLKAPDFCIATLNGAMWSRFATALMDWKPIIGLVVSDISLWIFNRHTNRARTSQSTESE